MKKFIAFMLVLFILAAVVLGMFIRIIPEGNVGIVTRLGAARDEYINPGPYFKTPLDTVTNMSTQEEVYATELAAFSSDIQQVGVSASVRYALNKEDAVRVFKTIGRDYEEKLVPQAIQESVKNVLGHYNAEKLVDMRAQASAEIMEDLSKTLKPSGLIVTEFAILNMDFSDAFEAAIEAKQVATQEKLKAQTQQEQQTIVAKAEADRAKIAAEAEAAKIMIAAQAESDAKKLAADAEAYRLKQESAHITDEIIKKEMIQKWDGKIPVTFGDSGNNILDVRGFMEDASE